MGHTRVPTCSERCLQVRASHRSDALCAPRALPRSEHPHVPPLPPFAQGVGLVAGAEYAYTDSEFRDGVAPACHLTEATRQDQTPAQTPAQTPRVKIVAYEDVPTTEGALMKVRVHPLGPPLVRGATRELPLCGRRSQ